MLACDNESFLNKMKSGEIYEIQNKTEIFRLTFNGESLTNKAPKNATETATTFTVS
jgi:hypothetical protein